MDCIFCSIAAGKIPSKKAFEDERVVVFYDIDPQAPTHLVMIPKEHIDSAASITSENSDLVAHIFTVAAKLSKELSLDKGFRIVTNCGEEGGQTVGHLHFHLLAGRNLGWPPG